MAAQHETSHTPETAREDQGCCTAPPITPHRLRLYRRTPPLLHGQDGAALLIFLMILLGSSSMLAIKMLTSMQAKEAQRRASTMAMLAEARDALIGFALVNGRLPCPALATIPSGTANAGLEPAPVLAGGCANAAGVLPWATLGIGETDAWGNRFTYRVTQEFTRTVPQALFPSCTPQPSPLPTSASFALCSQGNMNVLSTAGGSTVAATVPVVIVSHGKNGYGAYTAQGGQLPLGTDADELDNQLTGGGTATANTNFVSKTPDSTFDDHVTWLSFNANAPLYQRMVSAHRLP